MNGTSCEVADQLLGLIGIAHLPGLARTDVLDQMLLAYYRYTVDLCRKHGISEATLYNWKAKYGGLEVSDARRLKGLESENAKLKKLLADAMLDNAALKDLLAKKW